MKFRTLINSVFLIISIFSTASTATRVTGCFQSWSPLPKTEQIEMVTHLAVFSLGVASNGSLITQHLHSKLDQLVTTSHSVGTKVIVGVGGWGLSEGFAGATSEENRKTFVTNLKKIYDSLSLDGFNLDWEFPTEEQMPQYIKTIKLLKETIPSAEIGFAAAAQTHPSTFPDEFFDAVDIVELMTYDLYVGSNGHADWDISVEFLDVWGNYCDELQKKGSSFSRKCITFGIPFYARAIGAPESTLTYKAIEPLGGDLKSDRFIFNQKTYAFNGIETVTKKCNYAVKNGYAGVMIWAIDHDLPASNPRSLLNTIKNALAAVSLENQKNIQGTNAFEIMRNNGMIALQLPPYDFYTISLYSLKGNLLLDFKRFSEDGFISLPSDFRLAKGTYLLKAESSRNSWCSKIRF